MSAALSLHILPCVCVCACVCSSPDPAARLYTPGSSACARDFALMCVFSRSGEGINMTNDKGETYLHFAAFKAQPQLVKWLIEKGADCNMQV
jgi:hypothetical protein